MAEFELKTKMLVKDVMNSPVVTVNENETTNNIAVIMDKGKIGAVIITNKEEKSIGIITERDLVVRVIAKNRKPDEIKAKEIMTTPLMTIAPDATISDAARIMNRKNIRRLGVFYKGKLTGIVSNKDLLGVMPELIEITQEHTRIENANITEELEDPPQSGYCDNCEVYSENLKVRNGQNICDECRIELEEEE
ncbi:MAG: CBS domain-containing protein [Candidatus Bathyarchaeota archaeon]|uniref:CBS domain-containing protein n=1 Tax=Candidatus Bathycorpusculum sp. TaxID=2994959 RepID=UPI00281E9A97|nr:CBS domain-containing protein [Candidatus Termiticorpusculum sp.]MCL2257154.1 CBS domain-containing protein [Candidatus Termiticorpusculum sp.]MCL2292701.1 CBS domain-containing protein [Candidatus Termiticorpusculum sp.]